MSQNAGQRQKRLILGVVSLVVGLFAANLALFNWIERTGLNYLLANYARYVCAYGGFGAMIFGAMLVNDFLARREFRKKKGSESTLIAPASVGTKIEPEWTPVGTVIQERRKKKKFSRTVRRV